jgi:O-antigen/teichoic acid export membrane protein
MITVRLLTRCIDLGTLIVLGRLLSPADFGLVAIAMSVLVIIEGASELPLLQALIRLPVLDKEHYDTAFTLSILRGLVLASTLLILAWPMARLYGDPRLVGLLCALWIAPAGRSLGSPIFAEYFRRFEFGPSLAIEVTGKLLAFLTAVGLAWTTRSYWSIAAATIVAPVSMAVLSHIVAPYRPHLSLRVWREFAGFLGWSTAAQIVNAVNSQMDQLTLARFISPVDLGRFSMAANLSNLPTQVIVTQVAAPLMVAFSHIREDTRRLAAAYQSSAATMVAIGVPAMIGLSMIAGPGIRLILGEQWLPAAEILRWLSIAAIPYFFVSALGPLSMALNRTNIFLRLSAIEFCIKAPLILLGAIYYGVSGVVVVRLAVAVVMAGCSMFAVRSLTGSSVTGQILSPWRPVLSGVVMALTIWAFEGWLNGLQGTIPLALGLAGVVVLAASIYFASLFLFWRVAGSPNGLEEKAFALLSRYLNRITPRFAAR